MKKLFFGFTLLLAGVVAGCSGGDSGPAPFATSVTGVAAAGSPLQGTVYLKDSGSQNLSATIGDDGSFSFDISNLKKPFLLKASGTANGRSYVLYSLSREGGTANVNPLTQVVTANAAGGDPGAVFDAPDRTAFKSVADAAAKSLSDTYAALGDLLKAFDVATVNPFTDRYLANHTGLDRLFDSVAMDTGNGRVTLTSNLNDSTILSAPLAGIATAAVTGENIPRFTAPPRKWHLKKSVETTTDSSQNVVDTTVTSCAYDTSGDLVSVAESTATPGSLSPTTSTTRYSGFDAHGNPATFASTGQIGSAAYEYDAQGRVTKKTGLASVYFPTGRLYYNMSYTASYAYNADGSYQVRTASTKTFGTGLEVPVSEVRDYDSKGNTLSYTYNGDKILTYSYVYDSNGNTVTATFTNSSTGQRGTASYEWIYF